ncbi:MAG: hypothetical protein II866_13305 [Prevotella sp.]|nr:hypothetical protein [Prevotella sp.]
MNNVEINKRAKLSEHLTSSSVATLGHSSELDGSRLSPHFTLGELTKTNVNLKNVPNEAQVENLKRLCGWLEMLRSEYNRRYGGLSPNPSLSREGSEYKEEPIIINSGYRSEAVNKAVGGVAGSNHLTGCAVDIHVLGKEQAIRYACILLDIADESQEDFDELLIEQSAKSLWIHFAVRPFANRRRIRLMKG